MPQPTLHLMIGLPGAGKTTRAKQLEQEHNALRLCPDEWIAALLGPNPHQQTLDNARTPTENLQWSVAARALSLGINVILENGFWSKQERDDFRTRAHALGATVKLHFLNVPRHELLARLQKRNANLPPHTFQVTEQQLDQFLAVFQPPAPEELNAP
jgi:predicted kinase